MYSNLAVLQPLSDVTAELSVDPFDLSLKSRLMEIETFKAKTVFVVQSGPYTIQTIQDPKDLVRILELRHHSFVYDFNMSPPEGWIDFDHYDLLADHVVVKKNDSDEIIGTYRIICSDFSERFYSDEEFEISKINALEGVKIELGRACIHRDHRNGITLNLIWKGLAQYAQLVRARYLFGCASVKTVDPALAYSVLWNLSPGQFNESLRSEVKPSYRCPVPEGLAELPSRAEVELQIPPLLRSYLQAGSKLASEPALDQFFGCVDFLTVLDLELISGKYRRRYFDFD